MMCGPVGCAYFFLFLSLFSIRRRPVQTAGGRRFARPPAAGATNSSPPATFFSPPPIFSAFSPPSPPVLGGRGAGGGGAVHGSHLPPHPNPVPRGERRNQNSRRPDTRRLLKVRRPRPRRSTP